MENQFNMSGDGSPMSDDPAGHELYERGRRVMGDAQALGGSLRELAEEARMYAHEVMEEKPYAALATAAGVGFLLAGGLGTRFAGMLLGMGGRMVARHLAESFMEDLDRYYGGNMDEASQHSGHGHGSEPISAQPSLATTTKKGGGTQ